MSKKSIVVISGYRETSGYIADELIKLFGFDYDIKQSFLSEKQAYSLDNCSLIVCSSHFIASIVQQQQVNQYIPVVEARRNIEMDSIPEILNIKSGSTVYVVGANKDGAYEIINVLKEIGIHHLHLEPYYFQYNLHPDDIVISITKHASHNLNVKKMIYIEYKTLNIYTAVEIFLKLNLPSEKLKDILIKYNNDISSTNRRTNLLNQNLQSILELISDGILGVDDNGKIIFCNKHFSELMKVDNMYLIMKNLNEIFFEKSLMNIIRNNVDVFDEIIDYKDKKILVNKHHLPNSINGFILCIQDITKIQAVETKVRKILIQKGFIAKYTLESLIGESPIILSKISDIRKIAKNDFNVLIQGDNGTGKEMFAQAIHNESKRSIEPFVAVNIASLSDNLIESELFGYEEGAFTGAQKGGKLGLFEMAHKGTIFIDEIGDVSPFIQQRLLRVLQEREIMRVGSNRIIPIDVRVISATNQNLLKLMTEGKFRKDLYYRLKVLYIDLPDLQDRKEDIPLFFNYFFSTLNSKKRLSSDALAVLKNYSWPGNVRELQNLVYYFESLCDNDEITIEDIPDTFRVGDKKVTFPNSIEENSRFYSIISIYDGKMLRDFFLILSKLNLAYTNNLVLGRQKISAMLRDSGDYMTSGQIGNRMSKLQSHNFVLIGNTKQGSKITQDGIAFLAYLSNHFFI